MSVSFTEVGTLELWVPIGQLAASVAVTVRIAGKAPTGDANVMSTRIQVLRHPSLGTGVSRRLAESSQLAGAGIQIAGAGRCAGAGRVTLTGDSRFDLERGFIVQASLPFARQ